jgi:hypothetical protein
MELRAKYLFASVDSYTKLMWLVETHRACNSTNKKMTIFRCRCKAPSDYVPIFAQKADKPLRREHMGTRQSPTDSFLPSNNFRYITISATTSPSTSPIEYIVPMTLLNQEYSTVAVRCKALSGRSMSPCAVSRAPSKTRCSLRNWWTSWSKRAFKRRR